MLGNRAFFRSILDADDESEALGCYDLTKQTQTQRQDGNASGTGMKDILYYDVTVPLITEVRVKTQR